MKSFRVDKVLGVIPDVNGDNSQNVHTNTVTVFCRGIVGDSGDSVEDFYFGLLPEDSSVNAEIVRESLETWLNSGNTIPAYVRTVSNEEINKERTRRKELGIRVNGIYLRGKPEDRENLTNLYNIASARLAQGDNTTLTNYMDGDNVLHSLIPQEIVDCYIAGLTYIDALYNASWAVKAMDRNGLDYTNDSHWPANGLT